MTGKKRIIFGSLARVIIQLGFFILMPGAFSAAFSGVKYVFQQIADGNMLKWNSFVMALIGLCLFTILFGRFFCGYVCAFGFVGDCIYWLSGIIQEKIFHRKKQFNLPEKCVPWLQKVKYLILAAVVVLCVLGGYGSLKGCSPWTVFSLLFSRRFDLSSNMIGSILLFLIFIGMAIQERFFCQFLCPLGALFTLLPQLPSSWLKRDPENCIKGCRACQQQCPVKIKLETDGFRNGECIGCERCAAVCPKGNLTKWDRKIIGSGKTYLPDLVRVLIKIILMLALGEALGLLRISF